MTDDLLYQRRRYFFLGHHRDAGVTGIVWLVGAANGIYLTDPDGDPPLIDAVMRFSEQA